MTTMNMKKVMRLLAPEKVVSALGLPKGTTIGAVFERVVLSHAQPESPHADDEKLFAILLHCEVFLFPEQRDYLRSVGLLRAKPAPGEFRPWTPEQLEAEKRASDELLKKIMRPDLDGKPKNPPDDDSDKPKRVN